MAHYRKKVGDGNKVYLAVGTGEALTDIQDEQIRNILIAIYETLTKLVTHTNAIQTASQLADFPAFKAALPTSTVTAAVNMLDIDTGV